MKIIFIPSQLTIMYLSCPCFFLTFFFSFFPSSPAHYPLLILFASSHSFGGFLQGVMKLLRSGRVHGRKLREVLQNNREYLETSLHPFLFSIFLLPREALSGLKGLFRRTKRYCDSKGTPSRKQPKRSEWQRKNRTKCFVFFHTSSSHYNNHRTRKVIPI